MVTVAMATVAATSSGSDLKGRCCRSSSVSGTVASVFRHDKAAAAEALQMLGPRREESTPAIHCQ